MFDILIPTVHEVIFSFQFIQAVNINAASTDVGTTINIDNVHMLLGHGDEELICQTAKHLNWVITQGKLKPCLVSAMAKSKQKNVYKASTLVKSDDLGVGVFLKIGTHPRPCTSYYNFALVLNR